MIHVDENLILDLYKNGNSIRKIAKIIGVSTYTVTNRLICAGVVIRRPKNVKYNVSWTDNDINFIKNHYESIGHNGCSRHIDKTPEQIFRKAKSLGLKRVIKRNEWPKNDDGKYIVKCKWCGNNKYISCFSSINQALVSQCIKCSNSFRPKRIITYDRKLNHRYDEICDLYENGASINAISKIMRCDGRVIKKILVYNNIFIKRHFISHEDRCRIIELYNNGTSCDHIARLVNRNINSVYDTLKSSGIDISRKIPSNVICDIINDYNNGIQWREISQKFHISTGTITDIIDRFFIDKLGPIRGPNSHMWKGGITPINTYIRQTSKYFEWRNSSYSRFNFVSAISGSRGDGLNCHHIFPLSKIIKTVIQKYYFIPDEYKNMFICNDYRFYDINNGLPVTVEEHQKIEKQKHDSHPLFKLFMAYPRFTKSYFNVDDEYFDLFDDNGQIDSRNFYVKEISRNDCINVIKYSHYIGNIAKNTKIIYGAFVKNELIGICSFSRGGSMCLQPHELELNRLCVPYYVKQPFTVDFLIQCVKSVIRDYHAKRIITFADPSAGHHGGVYKNIGFKKSINFGRSSYRYIDLAGLNIYSEKTIKRLSGQQKVSDFIYDNKIIRINVPPKYKYVYNV